MLKKFIELMVVVVVSSLLFLCGATLWNALVPNANLSLLFWSWGGVGWGIFWFFVWVVVECDDPEEYCSPWNWRERLLTVPAMDLRKLGLVIFMPLVILYYLSEGIWGAVLQNSSANKRKPA